MIVETFSKGGNRQAAWLFIALALTAAIPVLLLGGWMAYITADKERSYARRAATEALTQVAHRIEGEISREMQVAGTLANSIAIDRGNLNDFYQEAARLVSDRPLWETASLTKPDQEQVLNVLRPLGELLGPITDTESFSAVLRARKPVLGGLGPYQPAIGKRLVALRVPVIRDGELRYILTIGPLPDQISAVLGQAGLPAGWQYLANTGGALGNPANYTALTPGGGQYTVPGTRLVVGQSAADPVAYPQTPPFPPIPHTFVRPGAGSLEDPAGVERAAIVAYTLQAEDFAAAGVTGPALVSITAYDFAVSTLGTPDGISARIYGGNNPAPLLDFSDDTFFPFPPGFRFETTLDPDPIPLGNFNVGDTIYVAIGANNVAVPEPATIALLAPTGLLLMRRRRGNEASP